MGWSRPRAAYRTYATTRQRRRGSHSVHTNFELVATNLYQ